MPKWPRLSQEVAASDRRTMTFTARCRNGNTRFVFYDKRGGLADAAAMRARRNLAQRQGRAWPTRYYETISALPRRGSRRHASEIPQVSKTPPCPLDLMPNYDRAWSDAQAVATAGCSSPRLGRCSAARSPPDLPIVRHTGARTHRWARRRRPRDVNAGGFATPTTSRNEFYASGSRAHALHERRGDDEHTTLEEAQQNRTALPTSPSHRSIWCSISGAGGTAPVLAGRALKGAPASRLPAAARGVTGRKIRRGVEGGWWIQGLRAVLEV